MLKLVPTWLWVTIAVLALTASYLNGVLRAADAAELASLKATVETYRTLEKEWNRLAAEDLAAASIAKEREVKLNQKIKDLEERVQRDPNRDRECLAESDTDGLRDLWE